MTNHPCNNIFYTRLNIRLCICIPTGYHSSYIIYNVFVVSSLWFSLRHIAVFKSVSTITFYTKITNYHSLSVIPATLCRTDITFSFLNRSFGRETHCATRRLPAARVQNDSTPPPKRCRTRNRRRKALECSRSVFRILSRVYNSHVRVSWRTSAETYGRVPCAAPSAFLGPHVFHDELLSCLIVRFHSEQYIHLQQYGAAATDRV